MQAIFDLYLELDGLLPVVEELAERGWRNKQWTTRKGTPRGGRPFDKGTLYQLLTNVAYAGKVRHKAETFPGEHTAIIDADKFRLVQAKLQRARRTGGSLHRNRFGAILKGLIHCGPCQCAMTPTHSKRGSKRYRYYACVAAQKRGRTTCPSKTVPAPEIEKFVVNQIKAVGQDPTVIGEALEQARAQQNKAVEDLEVEGRALQRDLARYHEELRTLTTGAPSPAALARLADLQEHIRICEQRTSIIQNESAVLSTDYVEEDIEAAVSLFDPAWETLSPREQARVIRLLVEKVEYDGHEGVISVTYRPNGIKALTEETV